MRRLAFLLVLSASAAQADQAELLSYLGGQGCAIGPANEAEIRATGVGQDEIDALKQRATPEGAWHVLPAALCEIRLPEVQSEVSLEDARPFLSAPEAHVHNGQDRGCFLDSQAFQNSLQARGWSEDRAFAAYLSFTAQGLVAGDWTFYSDSPLHTPVGVQYIGGACADTPGIDAMRSNHAVLRETFGAFVRESAPLIPCERGEILMHVGWPEIMERLSEGRNTNAWIAFEMTIIAMGAGWYDGLSYCEKGTPRPPMCHYP